MFCQLYHFVFFSLVGNSGKIAENTTNLSTSVTDSVLMFYLLNANYFMSLSGSFEGRLKEEEEEREKRRTEVLRKMIFYDF